MIFSILVILAQVGLEAYILGTLFHYVVKKDAKLEAFRSAVHWSNACAQHFASTGGMLQDMLLHCTHWLAVAIRQYSLSVGLQLEAHAVLCMPCTAKGALAQLPASAWVEWKSTSMLCYLHAHACGYAGLLQLLSSGLLLACMAVHGVLG